MSRKDYFREYMRNYRAEKRDNAFADYWLHGGRAKKAAYWAANKDELNRRRRERRAERKANEAANSQV